MFRIRTDKKGGAWCPSDLVDASSYEWIQIDLRNLTVVTHVETQGRYGNGEVGWRVPSANVGVLTRSGVGCLSCHAPHSTHTMSAIIVSFLLLLECNVQQKISRS